MALVEEWSSRMTRVEEESSRTALVEDVAQAVVWRVGVSYLLLYFVRFGVENWVGAFAPGNATPFRVWWQLGGARFPRGDSSTGVDWEIPRCGSRGGERCCLSRTKETAFLDAHREEERLVQPCR